MVVALHRMELSPEEIQTVQLTQYQAGTKSCKIALAPKMDGKLRIFVDYKNLNAFTVLYTYFSSRREELIELLREVMSWERRLLTSGKCHGR